MTNRTKSEFISHCRIAAKTNFLMLLLFSARFAHARYSSRMIDRFLNWGDHGKPKSGKIKGRCQPPLDHLFFYLVTPPFPAKKGNRTLSLSGTVRYYSGAVLLNSLPLLGKQILWLSFDRCFKAFQLTETAFMENRH